MRTTVIRSSIVALALIGTMAGCAKKTGSSTSSLDQLTPSTLVTTPISPAPSDGTPSLGASPGVTPNPGSTPTTTPSTKSTHTTPPAPPTYPHTGQGYTQATLDAYDRGNNTRLGQLADSSGQVSFANIGNPDKHWHFHNCVPDGAMTVCAYDNDNGDRISIDVMPTLLGKPQAVTNVVLDRTQFDNDADSMVFTFMDAWFNGNRQRMAILSSASMIKDFRSSDAPPNWTLSDKPSDNAHVNVLVSSTTGFLSTFVVTKSRLGKPHAIGAGPDA